MGEAFPSFRHHHARLQCPPLDASHGLVFVVKIVHRAEVAGGVGRAVSLAGCKGGAEVPFAEGCGLERLFLVQLVGVIFVVLAPVVGGSALHGRLAALCVVLERKGDAHCRRCLANLDAGGRACCTFTRVPRDGGRGSGVVHNHGAARLHLGVRHRLVDEVSGINAELGGRVEALLCAAHVLAVWAHPTVDGRKLVVRLLRLGVVPVVLRITAVPFVARALKDATVVGPAFRDAPS